MIEKRYLYQTHFRKNPINTIYAYSMFIAGIVLPIAFTILIIIVLINGHLDYSAIDVQFCILLPIYLFVIYIIFPAGAFSSTRGMTHIQLRVRKRCIYIFEREGLLPWKMNWHRFDIEYSPHFFIEDNTLNLVRRDLERDIYIIRKSKHNLRELRKFRNAAKKAGYKELTHTKWIHMKLEKGKNLEE